MIYTIHDIQPSPDPRYLDVVVAADGTEFRFAVPSRGSTLQQIRQEVRDIMRAAATPMDEATLEELRGVIDET
jgi:hypothetical protein